MAVGSKEWMIIMVEWQVVWILRHHPVLSFLRLQKVHTDSSISDVARNIVGYIVHALLSGDKVFTIGAQEQFLSITQPTSLPSCLGC